jgi:hypothetical protein
MKVLLYAVFKDLVSDRCVIFALVYRSKPRPKIALRSEHDLLENVSREPCLDRA